MKTISLKPLTPENFRPYGRYASMTDPDGPALGGGGVSFFRDLLPLGGARALAASVTQAAPARPMTVDVMEYHTAAWEGFITLDAASAVCVAPATAGGRPDAATFEAFHVPRCTMVYLHAGVWHYAPFPLEGKTLHSLVLLPERTYANDCVKVFLPEAEQVVIEG